MARVRVTVDTASHYGEWSDFRKQGAVVSALQEMGEKIAATAARNASAAGFPEAEFNVETSMMPSRARVSVLTSNYQARLAEAYRRALTNALYAGAGEY